MRLFASNIPREWLIKNAYDLSCANCGQLQAIEPSLMMKSFRFNCASQTCAKCGEFLRVAIDEKNEAAICMSWKDYIRETTPKERYGSDRRERGEL